MPVIIRNIVEIVQEQQRDTYFIQFYESPLAEKDELYRIREDHLSWLDAQGVAFEKAAPNGWLEGDPGCFAIYFDGHEDIRLAGYCSEYGLSSGNIIDHQSFQVYLVKFL